MGKIDPIAKTGLLTNGEMTLSVNGTTRQTGNLNQMIWKIPEMISYLSDFFELAAGDIIMTGTPAGVGAVNRGDTLRCEIEGLSPVTIKVV
jgi:fumarylpyruvate hydrolase